MYLHTFCMLKVQVETIWSTPQLLKSKQTLMDLCVRFHFILLFLLLIQMTQILRKKEIRWKDWNNSNNELVTSTWVLHSTSEWNLSTLTKVFAKQSECQQQTRTSFKPLPQPPPSKGEWWFVGHSPPLWEYNILSFPKKN